MHEEMSKKLVDRFWSKVDKAGYEDCWEWKGCKDRLGYGYMSTCGFRGKGKERAHRISFYLDRGYWPPRGLHVMHQCDNPTCVNPSHLLLGTPSDNVWDCINKGRSQFSVVPDSRLDEVRATLNGRDYREAAEKLGVTACALRNFAIRHGLRSGREPSAQDRLLNRRDEILEMVQEMPVAEIAKRVGETPWLIYRVMAKAGVRRPQCEEQRRRRRIRQGFCEAV